VTSLCIFATQFFFYMKVAIIQSSLFWENPIANRNLFEEKINTITEKVDLIVLPEMFSTGFTMNPEFVFETMQGEIILSLQSLAKAKNCAITGSLIVKENDSFYNRLVFVFPSGEVQYYDKRHLFTLAGEDKVYTAGTEKLIVEYQGWKICPMICYDLRFPVFSRNTEDYDVLIYVANWPKPRVNAWDILLKARAVENMCYTIGVNRIGLDDNNYEYNGHSQTVDFLGNYILTPQETDGIFIVDLEKEKMQETRNKLGFLNDRDLFELER
jgi:omega-amidase